MIEFGLCHSSHYGNALFVGCSLCFSVHVAGCLVYSVVVGLNTLKFAVYWLVSRVPVQPVRVMLGEADKSVCLTSSLSLAQVNCRIIGLVGTYCQYGGIENLA